MSKYKSLTITNCILMNYYSKGKEHFLNVILDKKADVLTIDKVQSIINSLYTENNCTLDHSHQFISPLKDGDCDLTYNSAKYINAHINHSCEALFNDLARDFQNNNFIRASIVINLFYYPLHDNNRNCGVSCYIEKITKL